MSCTGGCTAQVKPPPGGVLAEPVGNAGGPIYATFEGWGPLKDGTNALLLGYFNRNRTQTLDIPIGPDNSIEPGGPDYGAADAFPHRPPVRACSRSLVPKDFGNKKLTWTINANGHKTAGAVLAEPAVLDRLLQEHRERNEPPRIKFAMNGPEYIGPPTRAHRGDVDRDRRAAARSDGVGRRSAADHDCSARRRAATPPRPLPAAGAKPARVRERTAAGVHRRPRRQRRARRSGWRRRRGRHVVRAATSRCCGGSIAARAT